MRRYRHTIRYVLVVSVVTGVFVLGWNLAGVAS